jgi:aminopeptidase N
MVQRRVVAMLGALVILAACGVTDSGVTAGESSAIGGTPIDLPTTTVEATEPESTAPTSTEPVPESTPAPSTTDGGESGNLSPDGIGDPLYPDLGNPGIDVRDYALEFAYDPTAVFLEGSVSMTIAFTEDRDEFTLDNLGPTIKAVTVDGAEADFVADDPELRITLPSPADDGDRVRVVIEFSTSPQTDVSASFLTVGWFSTGVGSYVLNEPDGARTWFPSNDHPSDKATWTFKVTVPTGMTAVANGEFIGVTSGPTGDTWEWQEREPMPTYLMLMLTGDYQVVEGEGPNGLPLVSVVLRDDAATAQPLFDSIAPQIDFFDDLFGPYPLDRYGIALTDSYSGLAMETQGRSLFSMDDLVDPNGFIEQLLLAHELAHQWFGNAVTPAVWGDIWLNESFATYAQWLWLENIGLTTLEDEAQFALGERSSGFGEATASPTEEELFGFNVYEGGAVVLHALRRTIGDDAFFTLLRRWAADNEGTSRTTADFIALAEEVSEQDLTELFDDWLYANPVPAEYPESATAPPI